MKSHPSVMHMVSRALLSPDLIVQIAKGLERCCSALVTQHRTAARAARVRLHGHDHSGIPWGMSMTPAGGMHAQCRTMEQAVRELTVLAGTRTVSGPSRVSWGAALVASASAAAAAAAVVPLVLPVPPGELVPVVPPEDVLPVPVLLLPVPPVPPEVPVVPELLRGEEGGEPPLPRPQMPAREQESEVSSSGSVHTFSPVGHTTCRGQRRKEGDRRNIRRAGQSSPGPVATFRQACREKPRDGKPTHVHAAAQLGRVGRDGVIQDLVGDDKWLGGQRGLGRVHQIHTNGLRREVGCLVGAVMHICQGAFLSPPTGGAPPVCFFPS